jgi:hypothetical protein
VADSLYHIGIVALSGSIALLLPTGAKQFLTFWARIEHDKVSLIAIEMIVAVVLIGIISYIARSLRDRRMATAAIGAGLVSFFPRHAQEARQHIRKLRDDHGAGRTIKVIGSSGYNTLGDRAGDLAGMLDKCLGAHILLVNPHSRDASTRIQAIGHPDLTLDGFRDEVRQSIVLLKRLKAMGKAVKLKLYADAPLVKMAILGDYLWLQHYHADADLHAMPEYVLRHNPRSQGLYTLYTHYFEQRWNSSGIPEYDLDTDELVYRNDTGNEIHRMPLEQDGITHAGNCNELAMER